MPVGQPAIAPGRPRRLALCACFALAVTLAFAPSAIAAADPAAPQADARDTDGPLDLAEAVLAQRDVRMSLRVTTAGSWTHADLSGTPGRALCVTLVHGDPAKARGRICIATSKGRTALSYTALAADGVAVATRPLAADTSRPAPNVLEATFLPVAAGLPIGAHTWSVQTTWTDSGACAPACSDRLPDSGAVAGEVGLLGFPPCFGAAARDPSRPCQNAALDRAVDPPLSRPKVLSDPYCDNRERTELLVICGFGAPSEDAAGTFALIGDSHVARLKTALSVVTLGKRWRGYSIVRATCPATQASKPILPTAQRARECVRWNRQVLRWLAKRKIDTVFLSTYAGAKVKPTGGRTRSATARAGFRDEIGRLLRLVKRVVVIRDVPTSAPDHLRCLTRAMKSGRPLGTVCTLRRSKALRTDQLAEAARAMRSPRVHIIDLTDKICDAKRCYPVVGGALVQHDRTHLATPFAATLGPFILRALDR